MSSSSVATLSAQLSGESLQQPIFPIYIWSQVFDHVQALDNLDDMVWLWMDARHVSVVFKIPIENLFRLRYLPFVHIRVLTCTGTLDSNFLQPGGIRELRMFYFIGLSRHGRHAVFALRPDRDPRVTSDHETSCFEKGATIEKLTFERVHRFYTCLFLGLKVNVGEMVTHYTPPCLASEEPLKGLCVSWSKLFTTLLGEEKKTMASLSRSEALEPSCTNDDLAPNQRSVSNPVTPTKPPSRDNQTLANAPKKSQKLTRKFSEADLQESTPSKRPRLINRPSIAARIPEIAGIEQAHPLPIRIRQAHPGNEQKSNMAMQMGEDSRSRPYNRYNLQDSIEAGMERMQITSSLASENERMYAHNSQDSIESKVEQMEIASSLASEDEDVYTYNSQNSSEAETDPMEIASSLALEDEDVYTYNSQDSSEAETDGIENTPSLGSEDEDMFGDDEFSI